MLVLTTEITRLVQDAIARAQAAGELPAFDASAVEVKPSKRAEQGDYAAALMPLAKPAKMAPLAIAQVVARHLAEAPYVSRAEVVPPGYLNIFLNEDWLRAQVPAILAEGEGVFTLALGQGKRAQVEFVSANPTAPLHIGRSRGAIVGDTMARVLEAAGYEVQREYYFNNAGAQMRNLGNSLRLRYLEVMGQPLALTPEEEATFYRGSYLVEFAQQLVAEQGDALKDADYQPFKLYAEQKMFEMIKTTLARVDIHHDEFFNENSLYENGAIWDVLETLDEKGFIYRAVRPEVDDEGGAAEEADGKGEATWFRSSKLGDSKDRVLVKSSGEPTYTLPDFAYHKNKLERGFDVAVNVLGADHYVQHQVVKRGIQALGMEADRIHVILVQLVSLMRGGEVVRMSSRKGDFETLDDLIDQTSADAVRYMLLARNSDTHVNFDLDLAVKKSTENPVYYVQYAYVRCAGIFRETALRGVNTDGADIALLGDAELRFLRKALELGEVITLAAENFEPHRVAFFALEMANAFHPMFDTVRVLASDVPPDIAKARLLFYGAAQVVFGRVLRLMGMTTPDVM
ncbi:MAG: arginine--tRNA ligase [Pleurocapsa minor GSE-CHR-MK-17-07R]|jgi:arginyl-tRNA synthetase|nr:arginine--tRNA ligase [Pleurocapsa minor GSE-CHR-MK 17-07R]